MPNPTVTYPTGVLGSVKFSTTFPAPGTTTWGGLTVFAPMPGEAFSFEGTGGVALTARPAIGLRGTIDIKYTTGATGTARALLYLIGTASTNYIAVTLDTANRPLLTMKDVYGTTIAATTAVGSSIPTGTKMHIRLAWDASAAISGTRFVSMTINGVSVPPANWSSNPTATWEHFNAATAEVGWTTAVVLGDFNGTVERVQGSYQAIPGAVTATGDALTIAAALAPTAALSAAGTVVYAAAAATAPTAALTAALDLSLAP